MARQEEHTTAQCKFGTENYLFIRLVVSTCIPVMECVKLLSLQNHRPQRKETKYSIVRVKWEGRAGRLAAKTNTEVESNRNSISASPVSCRWHVRKAMCGKLGDLAFSTKMVGRSEVVVALPILSCSRTWVSQLQSSLSSSRLKDPAW